MRQSSEVLVRYAGVDPGAKTGVVIVELPSTSRDLMRATWVGSFSISGLGATKTRSKAEAHATLFERLEVLFFTNIVNHFAIECPVDALPVWGGAKGMPKHGAARGTLFSLGAHYGLALAAARTRRDATIASYRVQTTRKHEGWMPMQGGHVQKRTQTLDQLRWQIEKLLVSQTRQGMRISARAAAAQVAAMSEDEVMAFGVLRYHLARTPVLPNRG